MAEVRKATFEHLLEKLQNYLISIGYVEVQSYKSLATTDDIITWMRLNLKGKNLDEAERDMRARFSEDSERIVLSDDQRTLIKRYIEAMLELI